MDRLESGICVSVVRKTESSIMMEIYGVAKDSDIDAIKENVYKIAKDLTGSKTPNVTITTRHYGKDSIPLRELTMNDLL